MSANRMPSAALMVGSTLLASFLLTIPCSAAPTVALRVAALSEGAQESLKKGFDLGLAAELGAWGLEVAWAHDGEHDDWRGDLDLYSIGINGRVRLMHSAKYPYIDLGLGTGRFHSDAPTSTPLVGWMGVGMSFPVAERYRVRIDARYHPFASDLGGIDDDGNLEDYVTLGATLAFGPGASKD